MRIILFVLLAVFIISILVSEVGDYIYGYFLFHKIGSELTVNIKDDFIKAKVVAFWVFENIRYFEGMPVIDDNFLNIYHRGFGFCDQSAHVYATMMHWLGFEARLLMLKREDGISPHTVAIVKVKEKWLVVDTYFHFIFSPDEAEAFKRYVDMVRSDIGDIKLSWFENGIRFRTFPYAERGFIWKKIKEKLRIK